MNERVKEKIIHLVNSHEGIKSQNLLAIISSEFLALANKELSEILLEVIKEGEILEIEYIVLGKKSRSFFLPRNTEVRK